MLLPEKIHKTRKYLYYAFIVLLLAIGAGSSIFVYFEVNKSSRQHIVDRANTIAATVSQEQIAGLAGDASDIGTSQYENIKDVLVSIRSVNHDIRFVYIIGNRDNNLFFYVDSENPQSEDYSPPGQPYEEASQQMKDLFVVGIPSVEGPSADRWGVWISAYAPILDKSGHVVALLGVDTPARDYIINVITYASLPTLAAIFLVVVISIIQRMRAKELQYVDQKAEFLSIASHEIRTPLTGMRWTMENLMNRNDAAFDAQTKKLLAMMYESCMGLISRMNNLLSIASMEEGGKLPILKIEKVKIRGVIGDVVNSLALTARQRNIMISIGNSIRDELVVESDAEMIRHVFANLISNAIKYTRESSVISLEYKLLGNTHAFAVMDQGKGLTPEEQRYIFDGYKRTDSARKSSQVGTGLGLYLSKKIMEMLGGSVGLTSEVGKGSTFTVTLPLRNS